MKQNNFKQYNNYILKVYNYRNNMSIYKLIQKKILYNLETKINAIMKFQI